VLAPNNETWLNYVAKPSRLRGSFRFVTITLARGSYIELRNLTSYYTAAPSIKDGELQNYSGWCKIFPLWTRSLFSPDEDVQFTLRTTCSIGLGTLAHTHFSYALLARY
jgi:hypothetical protein